MLESHPSASHLSALASQARGETSNPGAAGAEAHNPTLLYRAHARAVVRYLYRRTGDHHVAEDLASEVFLRALRSLWRYRWRGVPMRHWLLRIADNLASNWTVRARPTAELQEHHLGCEEPEGEAADRVRVALARTPRKYRTVLTLHYLEDLGVEELAKLLGCRVGTVKSRLARGRLALREQLEQLESES